MNSFMSNTSYSSTTATRPIQDMSSCVLQHTGRCTGTRGHRHSCFLHFSSGHFLTLVNQAHDQPAHDLPLQAATTVWLDQVVCPFAAPSCGRTASPILPPKVCPRQICLMSQEDLSHQKPFAACGGSSTWHSSPWQCSFTAGFGEALVRQHRQR